MNPREFVSQLDEAKIVTAIAEAEQKTSGEICVYVSHKQREDALAAAHLRFHKLGMTKTRQRNAVLIYLAPLTHKFAIVGDTGIHEKCGKTFWQEIAGRMTDQLKKHLFTEAIITAIKEVGGVLAQHFPPEPGDRNELSNKVVQD